MRMTQAQYVEALVRLDKNKVRESSRHGESHNEPESALHDQIIAYCNSQWPKWKYIHARMDKRSTIQVGAPDFCPIFLPNGRILIFEAKRPGEKCSPEQLAWHKELEMLGHHVAVGFNFTDFLVAVDRIINPNLTIP